jgi:hypothetical protein
MAETQQLDQLFHVIMDSFVQRGQAPHFTEIARTFSVPPEEGKHLLQALMGTGIPAWLFPDTDLLVSFAPFSNLPTQYRITVEGQQKWFGQ